MDRADNNGAVFPWHGKKSEASVIELYSYKITCKIYNYNIEVERTVFQAELFANCLGFKPTQTVKCEFVQ